jgi:endoglucanase
MRAFFVNFLLIYSKKRILGKKIMYIYIMRYILLIMLMAVLSFATPVSEHGKLSVRGGKILDKNDNPFVLRGMSMFWNKWTEGSRFYKSSTVTTLAGSSWNANVVRVAIGDGNAQDAKNFMDWTADAGIYVIVDWHYHDLEQSNAETFFTSVSSYAKQKGYNHVLYEVFNEPIKQTWASIKSYAEKIIDVIRTNDPDGLIIVGNPEYSSDLASPRANPITGTRAKNVLYTLHFYTSDVNHNAFKANLQVAYCNDFPVFASEWGTSQADGNGTQDWNLTNGWMSLVESLGISWANWSITDKGESSAALSPGCCGGGTFGDGNLTASGKYVQRIMKNRNSGGSITSANGDNVNLTQQDVNCGSGVEKGEKTGIVKIGTEITQAVNFLNMSGAKDSTIINSAPVLQNTASTFSVGYKLTDIPAPGAYRMRIRYGGVAATVSWEGSGLQSGSAELSSSNNVTTWKNSEYIPITITTSDSETPLNLTFNLNGTSNFAFVNLNVSIDPNNPVEPNPIISVSQQAANSGAFAVKNGINLQVSQKASMEVFGLNGKSVRKMNFSNGSHSVSLNDLPKGLYIVSVKFDNRREILRIPVK